MVLRILNEDYNIFLKIEDVLLSLAVLLYRGILAPTINPAIFVLVEWTRAFPKRFPEL